MVVAVIDTGIDWTHPMFGGDPTPPRLGVAPASASVPTNQKVPYYLPLAGTIDDAGYRPIQVTCMYAYPYRNDE